ncbi:MerR family DNA-binding transcriptional regulator [Aeromicrobium sp. NPDC092404]|uniref:MerR family DNA-binding transcriptional regulator n=1 Tax=Aeromicrobium sp. NPDC092404 TaxID=3154976 RepID=UPI003426C1CA
MRIGEVARQAGVTIKAVRYYESLGLVTAQRLGNGYRDYDERAVRLVREVHALGALGIQADRTRPLPRLPRLGQRGGRRLPCVPRDVPGRDR